MFYLLSHLLRQLFRRHIRLFQRLPYVFRHIIFLNDVKGPTGDLSALNGLHFFFMLFIPGKVRMDDDLVVLRVKFPRSYIRKLHSIHFLFYFLGQLLQRHIRLFQCSFNEFGNIGFPDDVKGPAADLSARNGTQLLFVLFIL